jgi:quercetin dioxygenase-like cupin family protein
MTRCTYYRRAGVFGWFYDMKSGECIPRHSHAREMYHSIECVSGIVTVNDRILIPGEKMIIDSGVEHEITALGDARILNLLLEGDGGFTALDGDSVEE